MPSFSAKTIVFVVFPESKLLDLAGPLQVFTDAVGPSGECLYKTHVVSLRGGHMSTDTVVALNTEPLSAVTGRVIDTLIVSGGKGSVRAANDRFFLDAIKPLLKTAGARDRFAQERSFLRLPAC